MPIEIRRGVQVMFFVASGWLSATADGLRPLLQPTSTASAQRPDLTGVWELDLKASRLAEGGPIEPARGARAITLALIHAEPQIAVHYDVKGVDPGDDRRQSFIVSTDGTPENVVLNGMSAVAWAKWEGASLVVYHKRTIANDGYTETRRLFTLDGGSLRSVPRFRNKVNGNETPEFGGETEVWRKR
jgi:hypothetical protein